MPVLICRNMESRKPTEVGFLIVCLYSLASFLVIPLLPSGPATLAVSVWGAAASVAGVVLADIASGEKESRERHVGL